MCTSAIVIVTWSGFSALGTVYVSDGSAQNVQYVHDNLAQDGDTITLPAGTFSWTTHVDITKAITIQGQTTTDIANGTANDQTILIDNLVRINGGQPFFRFQVNTGTECRVTGITFSGVGGLTTTMPNGAVISGAPSGGGNTPFRLDHCHFTQLYHSPNVGVYGWNFGVADHNVFDFSSINPFSFKINFPDYGGYQNGDGAYAEAAGFGGPNFFFIEDNYIYVSSYVGNAGGAVDAFHGGKYVYRHNRIWNTSTNGHSTSSSFPRGRGIRAVEVYNNEMHFTSVTAYTIGGTTGGSMLVHDNTLDGLSMTGWGLRVYRAFYSYGSPFYGADGNSPWDYNVTEPDGTHVDGHPPYLFDSGTLSSASYPNLTDSTKNWNTNQWVNCAVTRISDQAMGSILSNINNTLAITSWQTINFAAGDQYQIHMVLRVMDQPGTGRGDLITGATPINTVSGTASWPRPDNEPCYSWNNIHSPDGVHLNFSGASTILQGRDYFNDTPMPGYTPYIYPHPLVTGIQPAASATLGSQRHLNKTEERKAKKIKKWKWGRAKEDSTNEAAERVAPDQ